MDERPESVLDACLEEMRRGRDLDEIVEKHAQGASELRHLLLLARELSSVPRPEPSDEAIGLTLLKMGEAVSQQADRRGLRSLLRKITLFRPVIAQALAFLTLAIIAVVALGVMASTSLPGDFLYPIKLTTERVQFTLTRTPEGKADLRLSFAGNRMEELIRVAEERLTLDETLLKELLLECQLALEEVAPADEDDFTLFAVKLRHLTEYHGEVLDLVKSSVPETCRVAVDGAVDICRRRCEWLEEMMKPCSDSNGEKSGERYRRWPPECRCMDSDRPGSEQ